LTEILVALSSRHRQRQIPIDPRWAAALAGQIAEIARA
jgi:hypothetical protein